MKTLIIMRHGEAAPEGSMNDFARPLTARGISQATRAGIRMMEHGLRPDIIIHSAAQRTTETAQTVAKAASFSQKLLTPKLDIYNAAFNAVLKHIEALPDTINTVLVVGHNPGMSYLAQYISSTPVDYLNTANFACLQLDTEHWASIFQGMGQLQVLHLG